MTQTSCERLSAQDSSYVMFEAEGAPVHITAVAIFGPDPDGTEPPDIERFREYVLSRLHLLPHYRQRLSYTPIQRHPIWVDDMHFDIHFHVRRAALPQPEGNAELKELASRIASEPLDLARPLWEVYFIEAFGDGGKAMVIKVHHSMVDGVSGVGALMALLDLTTNRAIETPRPWRPKPAPSALEFAFDGLARGLRAQLSAVSAAGNALAHPVLAATSLSENAVATWETLAGGLRSPAVTPINRPIGRQRRIDWQSFDLSEVKEIKKRLDGTVNDVILTVVAGAVRELLKKRRVALRGLDYRVVVPVDMRGGNFDMNVTNRVSAWFLSLPIADRDPLRRFEKVRTQTRQFKDSHAARGVDLFMRLADWAGSTRLMFWGVRLASVVRPYNLIVTNIHGPQIPLYLLGAPLRGMFPVLPLFERQGLAVAALSHLDKICVGINSDWDLVPDLADFSKALDESFRELRSCAGSLN